MASFNSYVGNGTQKNFPITIPYLEREHIVVLLNGVPDIGWTWLDSSTIQFSAAPGNGVVILIQRVTPVSERLAEFTNGEVLLDSELNTAVLQALYAAEEAIDRANQSIIIDTASLQYDFNGRRAINVADPVDTQDAATKGFVQSAYSAIVAALTAARDATFSARDTTFGYLGQVLDALSTTLGYRNDAAVSAVNAHTSELNAASSAADAAASAASVDASNLLTKSGNLAGIADTAAARTNLGLASGATTTVGTSATKNVGSAVGNVPEIAAGGGIYTAGSGWFAPQNWVHANYVSDVRGVFAGEVGVVAGSLGWAEVSGAYVTAVSIWGGGSGANIRARYIQHYKNGTWYTTGWGS